MDKKKHTGTYFQEHWENERKVRTLDANNDQQAPLPRTLGSLIHVIVDDNDPFRQHGHISKRGGNHIPIEPQTSPIFPTKRGHWEWVPSTLWGSIQDDALVPKHHPAFNTGNLSVVAPVPKRELPTNHPITNRVRNHDQSYIHLGKSDVELPDAKTRSLMEMSGSSPLPRHKPSEQISKSTDSHGVALPKAAQHKPTHNALTSSRYFGERASEAIVNNVTKTASPKKPTIQLQSISKLDKWLEGSPNCQYRR